MDLKDNLSATSRMLVPVAMCTEETPSDEAVHIHPAHPHAAGPEEGETPPSSNLDGKPAKNGFDGKVVEKTVRVINTVLEKDQKKMAFAIGKLLNENYEAERNRMGQKRLSKRQWAAALKAAGCKPGVSTLLQCGQLDEQNKVLSEEDVRGLSKTHLVVLLGVKDRERKLQFARDARENKWSSNELLDKIDASVKKSPRLPPRRVALVSQRYAKIFHSAEVELKNVRRRILDLSKVKDLSAVRIPAAEARDLLTEMDAIQQSLEPVYAKLRELATAA